MSSDTEALRAHHIDALTRRMQGAPAPVQRVLQGKLEQLHRLQHPDAGDPAVLPAPVEAPTHRPRRKVVRPPVLSPLAQLNQHIATVTGIPVGAASELKSAQGFRETWSRMRAEDDLAEAVQRGPDNAGPLNSHMLVLRTLSVMRDLSPDYLRRFIAQVDTLLWLEQASEQLKPQAAAGNKGKGARQKR